MGNTNEIIFVVEEDLEGGFNARALSEPIFTQGESVEELRTNIKDAVDCHFEPDAKPKMIRLHFVSEEVLAA